MILLLISPFESSTNAWEAVLFQTEVEAHKSAKARDLTKEHYILPVDDVVDLVRAYLGDDC